MSEGSRYGVNHSALVYIDGHLAVAQEKDTSRGWYTPFPFPIEKMNFIRKTLFLLCLMIFAQTASATGKLLVIETTDGSKAVFSLSANPELTFSGQTMLLNVGAQSHSFEIANVAQYYFENDASAIDEMESVKMRLRYTGSDKVVIEGISQNANVKLYSTSGTLINGSVATTNGQAVISLSSLPKGIYIISVNKNQSIKIHKR